MRIKEFFDVVRLNRRINTLMLENETLKDTIKDELYDTLMNKLGEPMEMDRLTKENQRLRKQVKTLKELIKEDGNASRKSKSVTRQNNKRLQVDGKTSNHDVNGTGQTKAKGTTA